MPILQLQEQRHTVLQQMGLPITKRYEVRNTGRLGCAPQLPPAPQGILFHPLAQQEREEGEGWTGRLSVPCPTASSQSQELSRVRGTAHLGPYLERRERLSPSSPPVSVVSVTDSPGLSSMLTREVRSGKGKQPAPNSGFPSLQ